MPDQNRRTEAELRQSSSGPAFFGRPDVRRLGDDQRPPFPQESRCAFRGRRRGWQTSGRPRGRSWPGGPDRGRDARRGRTQPESAHSARDARPHVRETRSGAVAHRAAFPKPPTRARRAQGPEDRRPRRDQRGGRRTARARRRGRGHGRTAGQLARARESRAPRASSSTASTSARSVDGTGRAPDRRRSDPQVRPDATRRGAGGLHPRTRSPRRRSRPRCRGRPCDRSPTWARVPGPAPSRSPSRRGSG